MLLGWFSEQLQLNRDITYPICTNNYTSFRYQSSFSRHHKGVCSLFEHIQLPLTLMRVTHMYRMDSRSLENLFIHHTMARETIGNVTKADPKSRTIQPLNCHTWLPVLLLTVPPALWSIALAQLIMLPKSSSPSLHTPELVLPWVLLEEPTTLPVSVNHLLGILFLKC